MAATTVKSKVSTTAPVVDTPDLATLQAQLAAAEERAAILEKAMANGVRLDNWYDEEPRSWKVTSGKAKGETVANRWQGYRVIGEGTVRIAFVVGPQGGLKIETCDPKTGWGHGGIRIDADNAQTILDYLSGEDYAADVQRAIDSGKMAA